MRPLGCVCVCCGKRNPFGTVKVRRSEKDRIPHSSSHERGKAPWGGIVHHTVKVGRSVKDRISYPSVARMVVLTPMQGA